MMVLSMFVREATMSDLFSLDVLGISDPFEMKNKREREKLTKLHFEETVRINIEGRYEVSLPWKENHFPIPTYDHVFKEWELLGIIENDPVDSSSHLHGHYLPHRPVVKQHGTTKIRPVFDASQTKYSGVAHVNILAAKSRIAPVKTVTIPHLELLAATVGVRLYRSVLSALQWDNVKQHYWDRFHYGIKLDSARRTLVSFWCSAHQLLCSRWWEGPKCLLQTEENWPVTKPIFDEPSVLKEKRKTNPIVQRIFPLEISKETFRDDVLKTKSGRTVKKSQKLDL
ncbi:integrase catalytic domain-containing protein [Trichonephila clavipes]|nr:integrase catalytic domain-containing protein [Trichonephila clavipes]